MQVIRSIRAVSSFLSSYSGADRALQYFPAVLFRRVVLLNVDSLLHGVVY